ncbi:enoyl-CoA-hydratase DpgB [Streptomyces sp. NPDC050164]|uniref:enoyl-CoA-hydratase DpgB n=1 Tax=Streptomyces sp. NPDC050164 TaxID=3365605 RepID=UPI0037ABD28F
MEHHRHARTVRLSIAATDPLSPGLVQSVNDVCDRVEDASAESVVLIQLATGPGATEDDRHSGAVSVRLVSRWERAVRRLERLPAPVLATVHGDCAGPAMEVLLATDYRIALSLARFRLHRGSGSVWPGMSLHRLVHQLGPTRARRLALMGTVLTAEDAVSWGVVDETVGEAALPNTVEGATRALTRMRGQDLSVLRRLLLDAVSTDFDDALGVHLAACDRSLRRSANPETALLVGEQT